MTRPARASCAINRADLLAILTLLLLVISLFWTHLLGQQSVVGNSDRLHTFLNVRLLQTEQLRTHGRVPAWTDRTFMGAPLDGLHWMEPALDPSAVLLALVPPQAFLWVAGLMSAAHVALAALAAYLLIRGYIPAAFPSMVGAGLYVSSVFAVHRIAQVDAAFAVLILVPLGLSALRRISPGRAAGSALLLTVLVTLLLGFTFLQEAAYALLLWGIYALFRAASTRDARPLAALALSGLAGLLLAAPRIGSVLEDVRELARGSGFGSICACEGLRWLHDGIFGRTPAEVLLFENNLNLHEGFQLYTSTLTPLLLATGLGLALLDWLRRSPAARGAPRTDRDLPFFAGWLALVFAVLLLDDVRYGLHVVFLKLDFSHTRVVVTGLLPICLLAAVALARLTTQRRTGILSSGAQKSSTWRSPLAGLALAVALFWLLGPLGAAIADAAVGPAERVIVARRLPATARPILGEIGAAGLSFGLLLAARVVLPLLARRRSRLRWAMPVPAYALGGLMLLHAHANAVTQLRGSATDTFPVPFAGNASLSVPPGVLQPPGMAAISALADRLETDRFRAVIVSAPDGYPSYGAPSERGHPAHVAQFWRLRLLDGYPTLPRRLADLPWPESSRTLRALSFPRAETLPWPLLAVLNVKYAAVASPELLLNAPSAGEFVPSEAIAARIQVLENPLQPAPRVFFARRIKPERVMWPLPDGPLAFADPEAATLALVPLGRPEPPLASCGIVEFGRVEPPCGVSAQATGPREITVRWQPLAHPEARAAVDLATSIDRPLGPTIELRPGEQEYVIGVGLRANTIYRIRVRTCYHDVCSPPGPVQQVTLGSTLSVHELDGQIEPDPVAVSRVGGIAEPRKFEVTADDAIRAEFEQDRVSLALTPASKPRFLVLNELYHPRWRAYAGDRELHILPTNKVMRGLLVPPGVGQIELRFVPFSRTWAAAAFAAAGVLVGLSGVLALGWLERRRAPTKPPRA